MQDQKQNILNLLSLQLQEQPKGQFSPDMLLAAIRPPVGGQAAPTSVRTTPPARPQQGSMLQYADQLDKSFFDQMNQRQGQVSSMQDELSSIQNQESTFQDVNLKPLLAYADSLVGSNTASSYAAPTGEKERKLMAQKLKEDIMKGQNAMGDDQLAYLKQKAQEEKDAASERRMLAKLGGGSKSIGWDTADREAGKDYTEWTQDGFATANTQATKLREAAQILSMNPDLTGGAVRFQPEGYRERFNTDSYAVQKQVESAIQNTLKLNLGGQFTEKEGMNVIKRAYNPNLPAADNIKAILLVAQEIEQKAKAKNEQARAFQQYGTIRNYSPNSLQQSSPSRTVTVSNGTETQEIMNPTEQDLIEAASEGFKVVR